MIMKKGNLVKSFGRRVLVVVASTDAFFSQLLKDEATIATGVQHSAIPKSRTTEEINSGKAPGRT
jgi:hypothetical protein